MTIYTRSKTLLSHLALGAGLTGPLAWGLVRVGRKR